LAVERAQRGRLPKWLLLPLLAVIVALLLWLRHGALQREAGAALFHGDAALVGRLVGHTEPLPAIATRCGNCHEDRSTVPAGRPGAASAAATSASASGSYAMALNREWLTAARPRRGGPPSVYDAASLCTVLRTGVDPAHVMVASVMPRYEASVAQCEQLWSYLTRR
jgi:hypothetical protein